MIRVVATLFSIQLKAVRTLEMEKDAKQRQQGGADSGTTAS